MIFFSLKACLNLLSASILFVYFSSTKYKEKVYIINTY